MDLDSAYRWARGIEDARIGLAGTTAGFAGYGFYGPDLSNQVIYLGEDGPHGAFNAIPTCARFRDAVNAADLDYLVTSPFLNFIHPGKPIPSPEARWLRGEPAVAAAAPQRPGHRLEGRRPARPAPAAPATPRCAKSPTYRHVGNLGQMSYPLANALYQWEEGDRELAAIDDPRAAAPRRPRGRRDPGRAAPADRPDLHRRRTGRPLRQGTDWASRSRSTWRRRRRTTPAVLADAAFWIYLRGAGDFAGGAAS